MIFDQNFIEFIELCNQYGVRYLVVGAMQLVFMDIPAIQVIWIFGLKRATQMLII
jgi:hypothetical protein